ncbi:MAG: bifunctional DNA primase/polymerase [Chloroflexi bacterium]|nr:bifunctional DNA primase/polymerase [Chloroflexota bacterium]
MVLNLSSQLLAHAQNLINLGLSIIPVRGGSDPRQAKIAAVAWNSYRQRFAAPEELHLWFTIQQHQGIAVVCGRLSRLIVLDFDERAAYERFQQAFPHLSATFTVSSAMRQTPHVYLRTTESIYGLRIAGGELRAEGQYVVTSPTAIGQNAYHVMNTLPIRDITADELQALIAALKPRHTQHSAAHSATASSSDITHLYKEEAPAIGRNNALYKASRRAKHLGWPLDKALDTLTGLHIEQRPNWPHTPETTHQRRTEAAHTIRSAFQKPHSAPKNDSTGLPTSIREKLISAHKTTTSSRLLDALRSAGLTEITEATATAAARCAGIGRQSVLHVLNGKWAQINGKRLLPIVNRKNMLCKATAGVKKRGRTPRVYRVPSDDELYLLLGVPRSQSDPLTIDDLRSAQRYRMALHRSLLERRPGEYARGWLAQRLGVSARTVQRYNRTLQVQVTPVYGYLPLTWANVETLPLAQTRQRVTSGRWLQDSAGKRYPALRPLAYRLLKSAAPLYLRRLPNHYALRLPQPPAVYWRCLRCGARTAQLPARCDCHTRPAITPDPAAAPPRISECIHCGQLCFGEKLVCTTCRHKPMPAPPRITIDKDGKPRFPLRFVKTRLTFAEVKHLVPTDEERADYQGRPRGWLEDGDGQRYPAIQGLAYRLLREHHDVFVVTRDETAATYYAIGVHLLKRGRLRMGLHFLRKAEEVS